MTYHMQLSNKHIEGHLHRMTMEKKYMEITRKIRYIQNRRVYPLLTDQRLSAVQWFLVL